jgi:signal transduction histidine kinase
MVLALAVIAVIGVSGMWIFTDWTLRIGFEEIEVQVIEGTVLWGVDDLYDFAFIIDSAITPIAAWDDMYDYVETRDQSFVDEIFSDIVLTRNQFNLVVIYADSGELIYGRYYDYQSDTELGIPSIFRQDSTYETLRKYDPETNSVIGVISNQGQPIIISSRPIVDTSETAPSRGTLVVGFDFSETGIEHIQELTGLPLEYYEVESDNLPAGLISELTSESPFSYRITKDTVRGFYLVEDIFGAPALVVSVAQPREVYMAGEQVRREFLSVILGIGFLLGTVAIVYADRIILHRVTRLSDEISEITEIDDLIVSVENSGGNDEISLLTERINEMLQRLDESRAIEKKQQEEMDKLREENTKEIFETAKKISYLVNTELERPLRSMKQVAYNLREENNKELSEILESSIKYSEATLIELASLSNLGEPKRTISDLNEVVEAAIANVEHKVRVSIESNTSDDFLAINIDAIKVTRAIENIIRNAVESIDGSGAVKVSVNTDDKTAKVTITDNGGGIPENQIDYIFEPFFSTKKNAIGLGLVYAKQVIDAHRGKIKVESKEGVGTTVTIEIPRAQPTD